MHFCCDLEDEEAAPVDFDRLSRDQISNVSLSAFTVISLRS